MSDPVSAADLGGADGWPAERASSVAQLHASSIGVTSATGLVVGSIIGTGVFAMPGVLAEAGTSSLITLAVIAVGSMLLATMFGQLTRRVPSGDGGLYAYTRHEFGDFAGFITGWSYWISAGSGNAAIVAVWVFYVNSLFGIAHPSPWGNCGIALIGLWLPALVNLAGVKHMAWFQNLTVLLKFLPLLLVGVVGWLFVGTANFGPFNASGGSLYSAIGIAAGVALFAFFGVEVAAMTAKRVRSPRQNVGRASLYGTAASAVLYLAASAAVMGLVAHKSLAGNGAPFVAAFQAIFGHGLWAGKLVAAVAVVSGIGALNGWTLVTTELSRAMAADGLFPKFFAWSDRKDTAWVGILFAAALPSVLMVWSYNTRTGLTVFTYLVNLTVVNVALPYLFSACAQLRYLVSPRHQVDGWRLARDLAIAGTGALFSMWVTFATGWAAMYQAMVLVLAGVIIYALLAGWRERTSHAPEPPVPGRHLRILGNGGPP